MTVQPILQPGELEVAAGAIVELRLPPARVFADRAQRLRQLARGHSLGDYLHFIEVLSEGQQEMLDNHPSLTGPKPPAAGWDEQTPPPLAPAGWKRHSSWLKNVRLLAETVFDVIPSGGRSALALVRESPNDWLESQAEQLLAGRYAGLNLATAPLIGAALQVQWTVLARQLDVRQFTRHTAWPLCPVCGGEPVASIIHAEGGAHGLRYLHCSLCNSQWHMVRSKCSNCDTTQGVAYYGIEDGSESVRAEACPACHSYLKVIHRDKDLQADPVGDDLATLGLDLLMGEKNLTKSGGNFFFLLGNEG